MISYLGSIVKLLTTEKNWLLYTTSNEDSQSELTALNISSTDDVLSITGSGCRSLALLANEPKSLTSVDAVPEQNYLLELKLSAFEALTYEEVLQFLGIHNSDKRLQMYEKLKPLLSDDAAIFWDKHKEKIKQGVIFTGRQERFYRNVVLPIIKFTRGNIISKLLKSRSIEEQRILYKKLNTWLWRRSIQTLCRRSIYKFILNDPSYYAYSEVNSLADYLISRLDYTFTYHPIKENHWLTFLLSGNYIHTSSLPVYLYPCHYEKIRRSRHKVKIVTAPLEKYLQEVPDNSFDKFSLSDISGWMSEHSFEAILSEIIRVSRNRGIFCYRNFLSKRTIPENLTSHVQRLDEVIKFLNENDRSFAFTFEVGMIKK
ncbi:DUF3419 family protein [Geobacillus icigianus]|uniref:DUF3419 domain-containing protein n=1 Tax=Geobacillus icigianus TaxID=1430331 RepID=A0ABU6BJ04_9BACL|nr:DUF3419 family protein [Geobacillus icigianus]MEB3751929.1 hypothetical protein [Geobacillus icigianus]